jgi:hypothetical protein
MKPSLEEIFSFVKKNTVGYLKVTDEELKNFIQMYLILKRTFTVFDENGLMVWGTWDEQGDVGIVREVVVRVDKRGYKALKYLIALLKARRQHLNNITYERVAKGKPFRVFSIEKLLRRR